METEQGRMKFCEEICRRILLRYPGHSVPLRQPILSNRQFSYTYQSLTKKSKVGDVIDKT